MSAYITDDHSAEGNDGKTAISEHSVNIELLENQDKNEVQIKYDLREGIFEFEYFIKTYSCNDNPFKTIQMLFKALIKITNYSYEIGDNSLIYSYILLILLTMKLSLKFRSMI